jgi:hypothetical protein
MNLRRESTYNIALTENELCQALACIAAALDSHRQLLDLDKVKDLEDLGTEIWDQLKKAKMHEFSRMIQEGERPTRLHLVK